MSQNVFGKIIASNFFATTKGGKKRIDLTVLVNNPQNFWERSQEIRICIFAEDGFNALFNAVVNGKHPFEKGTPTKDGVKDALVGSFWGFAINRLEVTFAKEKSYRTYKVDIHDPQPLAPCEEGKFGFDRSNIGEWRKDANNMPFIPMNDVAKGRAAAHKKSNNASTRDSIE